MRAPLFGGVWQEVNDQGKANTHSKPCLGSGHPLIKNLLNQ